MLCSYCSQSDSSRPVYIEDRIMSSYLNVVVSPGNVPVYHSSTNLRLMDRRVRVAELVLRCLICALGVVAAALVATDTQVKQIFTIQKKAKFTDMKALVFLVISNGIVATYSFVQVLRCVVSLVRGSVLLSKPIAWTIFSADQVMAYMSVCAVGAAAQSAVFAKLGQPEVQWMKICNMYDKFCDQVGEGIASALLLTIATVLLSCVSAFNLFRLYGASAGNTKTTTAGW